MTIIRAHDYAEMSAKAAELITAQLLLKPDCVLGLATGSTPLGIYDALARKVAAGSLSFARARSINLDEYVGLSASDRQSYAYFMRENLFKKVDFADGANNIPNGVSTDVDAECARYDSLVERLGGIDLQLLGLGPNGHIGFNEPSDAFEPNTHLVELTENTIAANARFFGEGEHQPTRALTIGVRAIMQAKTVLLAVSGEAKANALRGALFGPITPRLPASILQLHPRLFVVADDAAMSAIDR